MTHRFKILSLAAPALVLLALAGAGPARADALAECVAREVLDGDGARTAAEIRALCAPHGAAPASKPSVSPAPGAAQERPRAPIIEPHQPTYLLFSSDREFDAASSIYAGIDPDFASLEQEEVKFQVSARFPVWRGIAGSDSDLYFGYTQTSWWQVFSDEGVTSAPFRETNYEPEMFLRMRPGWSLPLGGRLSYLDLGLVHQSNGRAEPLSRSWNRLMARTSLDFGDLALQARAWYRLPEDAEDDDNPGEYRYLGYGDLRAVWTPNRHTFSLLWRPGTEESGQELTWSYPVTPALRLYAQWWYGYGESLIDYDRKVNRFGIGIAINDFLSGG